MNGAGCYVAAEPRRDVIQDRPAVRILAKPDDSEQDCLLERAKRVGHLLPTL
jgi:hypothetical protein